MFLPAMTGESLLPNTEGALACREPHLPYETCTYYTSSNSASTYIQWVSRAISHIKDLAVLAVMKVIMIVTAERLYCSEGKPRKSSQENPFLDAS